MENSLLERKSEILSRLAKLPEITPHAMEWLNEHYYLSVTICDAGVLTEAQREDFREWARQKNDPEFLALVELEKLLHSTQNQNMDE